MGRTVDWMMMSSQPDFSYGRYLEQAYHAETIAIAVDDATRRKIASDEELSERSIQHNASPIQG